MRIKHIKMSRQTCGDPHPTTSALRIGISVKLQIHVVAGREGFVHRLPNQIQCITVFLTGCKSILVDIWNTLVLGSARLIL